MDQQEKKQKQFAYDLAMTRDPKHAAILAGFAEEDWVDLLEEKNVLRELRKIKRRFSAETPGEIAKRGLERIVFARAGIMATEDALGAATDFFEIAEAKQAKNGATELKFWDKLKALELLVRLQEQEPEKQKQTQNSIFAALEEGARALRTQTEPESESK